MSYELHAESATFPAIRQDPIRMIVEHNAARKAEGSQQVSSFDGSGILIAAVLTIAFAALACWIWWSTSGKRNHASIGFSRVSRRLGLDASMRTAVLGLSEAVRLDATALLMSTEAFDRAVKQTQDYGLKVDRDELRRVRQQLGEKLEQPQASKAA